MSDRRGVKVLPDKETLLGLNRAGLTHQQMADWWHGETGIRVTRQAFSQALRRTGVKRKERWDDLIPWRIKPQHAASYKRRSLQRESRRRAGLPVTESAVELARFERELDAWLEGLRRRGTVIWYEPDSLEGFCEVRRIPEDGNEIIRRPEVEAERLRRRKPR